MTKTDPHALYYDILEQEVRFARAVGYKAMRLKPFSVWEILIPIVFILGFMRTRNNRERFVQNFIFTKKMALKGVLDMHAERCSLSEISRRIEIQTGKLLDTIDSNVYSESIRQAQLAEVDLLISYYNLLFQADPGNYSARIVSVYREEAGYLNFIQRLNRLEKAVADAAIQTLGADADRELMARIETSAATLRRKNAKKYFANAKQE